MCIANVVQALAHLIVEVWGVFIDIRRVDQRVLDASNPAIQDVSQRAARAAGGAKLRHDLGVHLVKTVKLQVVVAHHHEAGSEVLLLGIQHGQTAHEGLAAAITAAQKLDAALAVPQQIELTVDLSALLFDPHGKGVDAALRDDAGAQLLEDVADVLSGERAHLLPSTS
ncbi:MAG: hypothetical protein R3B89_06480 [Polyangiaceae bacterium]